MTDRTLLIWQLVVVVFVGGWVAIVLSVRVRRLEQLRARQPYWSDLLGKLRRDVHELRADHERSARRQGYRLDELQVVVERLETAVRILPMQLEQPAEVARAPDVMEPRVEVLAERARSETPA